MAEAVAPAAAAVGEAAGDAFDQIAEEVAPAADAVGEVAGDALKAVAPAADAVALILSPPVPRLALYKLIGLSSMRDESAGTWTVFATWKKFAEPAPSVDTSMFTVAEFTPSTLAI